MSKSAVMVFSKKCVEMSSYTYLGIDFACNGAWYGHLKRVLDDGRNQLECSWVVATVCN